MPGIAGLISSRSSDTCRRLVDRMTASMQHEKFHVSGSYSASELGVFAGWAALEGSFANCQPILNDHGDVTLLLSGECLLEQGTDAKKLLQLYEETGVDLFDRLNGLFSGLLIDRRLRKAFLFNDRYGIERVYYHQNRDGFYFASEAKALLRVLPELRAFDQDGLAQFLQYGCTLEWRTLFRKINILPGASVWGFVGDEIQKRRYFSPASWESQPALESHLFATTLEETFTRVLPRYFRSDTNVGISLTAGLDTRMIMACRADTSDELVAYTFASSSDTLDVRLAARVAAACGVPHHILRLDDQFFSDFASLADRTIYATDGCWGVCGAHEIYLHEQARVLASVRLTGNYGSEILRGATTLKPLGLCARLFNPDFTRSISDPAVNITPQAATHPVSRAAFQEVPWQLFGVFRAAQSQVTMRTPYLDNDIVALAFQSPERLRKSSWPAVQVIRHNHRALSKITTDTGLLPSSHLISLLNGLWYRPSFKVDYWRNVGLPGLLSPLYRLLSHVQVGHSLLPEHRFLHYRRWFRTELAEYLRDRLSDPRILQSPLWNKRFLGNMGEDHISGRTNYLREIDAVLTCSAIDRLLLGGDV